MTNAQFPIVISETISTIQIPKSLTVLEAVKFKQACHKLLEENSSIKCIILNFEQTEVIDSSGIGALIHNLKATKSQGVELIIDNAHSSVKNVLSMTGLDKILIVQPSNKLTIPSGFFPQKKGEKIRETHPSINSKLKRLIDIVGSLVGLTITSILFIPIAIAIKIDSPGPIFFGQIRCGWMGKKFRIWKFRSMCSNAEFLKHQVENQATGAFFKNENDPRITRVGRFLRRTSLDELPQFWNVLKGDMSLVGTRPPTPDEVERYEVPEWQRLNVKPGMTGEWQVHGRSTVKNFEDVIKLDLKYQHNWSIGYDLKLILKTILVLFNKKSGAV